MIADLAIRNARVLTLAGQRPRRGAGLGDLGIIERADVLVGGGRIQAIESGEELHTRGGTVAQRSIDAAGRVLMPGFVDAHTHACWAGSRVNEWQRRLGGDSYLEILRSGGGIMSTVRAVREATRESLAETLLERLERMLAGGTTSVEVKSGYGLSTEHELKMLGAIADASARWPGRVVATACIGHAKDPDEPEFVRRTVEETLPAVSAAFPGIAIDAYCEDGAWSLEECTHLFRAATDLGHPVRVHADQFNSLGMTPWAFSSGALSVDHLEATTPEDLSGLARSKSLGVMLPISGFHTDGRYADGRGFVDAGGALALATNFNPGSAPSGSMPLALALAVRLLGLSFQEAIAASTINGAALLGLADAGSVEVGQRADLVLLHHRDERELVHEIGGSPVRAVVCGGVVAA
ncbi:MAG: imidazolonepropionase [Phycisphaeraceae bacterium]|nr:imidazolonepropionase [Phycisphaeraceae bacterium]